VRDAAVLVESLKQLTRRIREQRYKAHADRARRLLLAELSSSRKRLTGDAMRRSAARLNKVNQRLSIASPKATDTESARLGMKNIYRKGRIACTDAKRRRSTEQLHEWRKQAKYLSNEATLMGKWFGRRLKKIRSRSQKLSTLLGEDHDLVLLKAKLQQLRASGLLIDGTAGDSFDRKIKRRREKLQSESFKLAKRLYRRSPDKFVAAIRRSFQNVDKG
jgi:CHAD domain-containing protein